MPETFGKRQRAVAKEKKAAAREERRLARNRRREDRAAGILEPGSPLGERPDLELLDPLPDATEDGGTDHEDSDAR